jgi:DNA repair protein RadC
MHLDNAGGLVGLARATPRGLRSVTSLCAADATRVCAAFELGRRAVAQVEEKRAGAAPMSAEAVARWARPRLVHLDHEEVWVLCLDGRSSLLCARQVGRGGVHGCALLARDVLVPIVREAASAFVLVHNHPSGDPTPSREDLDMTRALAAAADLLCVPLLDHVVVARGGYRSMFEMGFFDRS